jgi:hypothetical protein
MLQVLHLDISKVDRGIAHEMHVGSGRGASGPCTSTRRGPLCARAKHKRGWAKFEWRGPCMDAQNGGAVTDCSRERPFGVWALAVPIF